MWRRRWSTSLSLTRRHVSVQSLTRSNGSSLVRALRGAVARVRLLLACRWQALSTLTSIRGTSCLSNIPWMRALLCTSLLCPAPLSPALPPSASPQVVPCSLSPLGLAVQPPHLRKPASYVTDAFGPRSPHSPHFSQSARSPRSPRFPRSPHSPSFSPYSGSPRPRPKGKARRRPSPLTIVPPRVEGMRPTNSPIHVQPWLLRSVNRAIVERERDAFLEESFRDEPAP